MRAFLIAGTALALAGCTVGPNYSRPEMPLPASYAKPVAAAAGEVDVARWWTAFGDPRLSGLVERALADNPTILASMELEAVA